MDTSPKAQYDKCSVILSLCKKATQRVARRSHSKKIHTTFVILSDSKKSTLLLSYWALAKNPKKFKTHFKFMDTSPKAQYDKTSQYDKKIA